jgi:glutamate N-acetyltransferase/amino-acid N-acetyltransferase
MTVNLAVFEDYTQIEGVRLGITQAGVRYPDRDDLVVLELAEGSKVAGVFTRNAFCAAPVLVAREHLQSADIRYLVINTGNANAGTGHQGRLDALETCRLIAEKTGVAENQVLPFSTGVIGEPLNMGALRAGIPVALDDLGENNWGRAAAGIMTTDTTPKGASEVVEISGHSVVVTGMSKGAGMIKPDMATMLGFIATDASVSDELLSDWCGQLANASFNRITIDGDTSTNDACMLMATGRSGLMIDDGASPEAQQLFDVLKRVFQQLAQAIVRDGEGATKFVTVDVEACASAQEALDVAYTVAHSPLVKTAMYASDANWGRILAAVGRAGLPELDLTRVNIWLDDVQIVSAGERCPSYTEEAGSAVFAQDEFRICIDLGRGSVSETLWTSDLSHEYVTINAEYRS